MPNPVFMASFEYDYLSDKFKMEQVFPCFFIKIKMSIMFKLWIKKKNY